MTKDLSVLLHDPKLSEAHKAIVQKVIDNQRISFEEGVFLFEHGELAFVGALANFVRERKNGDRTFFNRNFHIEPTNLCVYDCKFCSYSRLIKQRSDADAWAFTMEDMLNIVYKYDGQPVTEVHIVGGVLPQYDLPHPVPANFHELDIPAELQSTQNSERDHCLRDYYVYLSL